MSESHTMFNERDRRCAAVKLMPPTDPSYDHRTIARPRTEVGEVKLAASHGTEAFNGFLVGRCQVLVRFADAGDVFALPLDGGEGLVDALLESGIGVKLGGDSDGGAHG